MKRSTKAAQVRSVDRRRQASTDPKRSGRGRGISDTELLVVIDATEASERALQYVGRFCAGRRRIGVHLAYIASRLPPELLEFGGSERAKSEDQLESKLRGLQRRWMAVADRKGERILSTACATLRRAGVGAASIRTCMSSPRDARRAVDEVLLLAREEQCSTIVVGHRAHAWFRGLGGGHLTEQLVRHAKGRAIWVID